jgi:two-component system response regulator AtoC
MPDAVNTSSLFQLPPDSVIFGRSAVMRMVRSKIEKLACSNVPVLIQGESGTGKEIVARLLHSRSPWEPGPFVKVNCPAIPGTLLESELFGYEKGAFTGAYGAKPGRVELAHRGTLFLDEIGELDSALQAKLLQLLQDGQFCRIGAQEDKRVEVRMICATNRSLQEEIESGNFRQDLFYRINVLNVHLPPLRERGEDIPALAEYFRELHNEKFNCKARPMSAEMMRLLQEYHWPGNIRELDNVIKRYVILGSEESVRGDLLASQNRQFSPEIPLDGSVSLKIVTRQAVRELERVVILRSLQANNWNRKRVARALSISYRALLYKIRDAGLDGSRARKRMAVATPASECDSSVKAA